jgi:hypothetical protein
MLSMPRVANIEQLKDEQVRSRCRRSTNQWNEEWMNDQSLRPTVRCSMCELEEMRVGRLGSKEKISG